MLFLSIHGRVGHFCENPKVPFNDATPASKIKQEEARSVFFLEEREFLD